MYRKANNTKNKRQISTVGCRAISGVCPCPAVIPPTETRPSTRPRKPKTRQKNQKNIYNNLRLKCQHQSPSGSPRPANQLGDAPVSIIGQISDLGWIFDGQMWYHNRAWRTIEENWRTKIVIEEPQWTQAPTSCPLQAIDVYLQHLNDVWKACPPLQIPDSWSVFENVNWEHNGYFQLCSTDSEPTSTAYHSSGSSGSPPDPSRVSSRPPQCKTVATCRGRNLTQSRVRGQWNAITTMTLDKISWRRQTKERALRRNRIRHAGYVDLNQQAPNHDMWPQHSFPPLIFHCDANRYEEALLPTVRELPMSQTLGRWIANAVETELFPAQCRQLARWPRRLMNSNHLPMVDYICRATPRSIGWHEEMCPLLFAAQFDINEDFNRCGEHSAARRLASVFHPMMVIFILYYLDTRTSTDDPMPPWMVLFGIYYNENGMVIRGHYPSFQPPMETYPDIRSGWNATSSVHELVHRWAMLGLPHRRGPLISTLNRIQGHCLHVLERLKAWKGYEPACRLLMA